MSGGAQPTSHEWLARALVLALVLAPLTAARAQDDDLGGLDDDSASKNDQAQDQGEGAEGEGEHEAEKTAAATSDAAAAEQGPRVSIRPYAGAGISHRTFSRPSPMSGVQKLSASPVPAVEAGLDVIAWPQDAFSLAFALHYRSAIGLVIQESPPFALANETKARSEEIELSIAPGWQLSGDSLRLAVPIGMSMRTLWPNVHTLLTPGYSLIGPHARIELIARMGGPVSLRLGPEVQWIVLIDKSLRDSGVNSQGIAIGGEAALTVDVSKVWAFALAYRESHAIVNTTRGVTFEDVERYLTIRVSGAF
jgi:hypothetical protein